MADFNDVIKAVKETSKDQVKAIDNLKEEPPKKQMGQISSAASAETARDKTFFQNKQLEVLQEIAESISKLNERSGGEDEKTTGGGLLGMFGGALGGLGRGVGGLGRGIGRGLGGVLKGLAVGIAAFGNPKVLIGAGILAASIAVIGAAVSAATFLVGKSLPTFAEGMKKFEELDGDKLAAAGKGMRAVGGGLAAFGAGQAVQGLGSLIGGITQGITKLFGGEDPLEKLKRFQAYNFDEPKITNNAKALVSYGKGMAALGKAEAISGIGAAVSAIGGSIAKFFGEDDPLTKMQKFQKLEFNANKIKTNALAIKAYADAIKDFPKSPSVSVFSAFKNGIVKLLGGDTDPFAPMIRFGGLKFNTKGIKTNALAVKAYAEAVKDFPQSPSASLFTAFKNSYIKLLGGDTDPFKPLIRFGGLTFNTEGIKTNALAVKAYAEAVKDFPESPGVSLIQGIKDAIVKLLGGNIDPFVPLKRFGEMTFNTKGINTNAKAVSAYANAIKDFPSKVPSVGLLKGVKDSIVNFLGGDTDPFKPMKKFGDLTFNTEGIIKNAKAVSAYADAIKGFQNIAGAESNINDTTKFIRTISRPGFERSMKAIGNIKTDNAAKIFNALKGAGLSSNATVTSNQGQNIKTMTVENLRVQVANMMDQRDTAGGGSVAQSTTVNQNRTDNSKTFTGGGSMRTDTPAQASAIRSAGN